MAYWLKVLLFGGGVAVAGVGTAYLSGALDPWFETTEQPMVASLPEGETRAEPAALQVEDGDEIDAEGADIEDTAAATVGEDLVVPEFDLVRVEPDGSMVIAGRAEPDATVEVLTGSRVLATVGAGAGGDFAAVLDEPLPPGDYQIVLRSTSEANVVSSVETAIVSVPETADGQVLALVEEPGSPSRLIMVPEATEAPILDEDIDLAGASQDRPEGEAAAQAAAEEAQAGGDEVARDDVDEPQPEGSVAELDLAESAPEPQQPVEAEVTEMEPDAELAEEAVAGAEETEEDVAESASAEEEVAGVSASAGDATSPVVTDEPSQDAVADGGEAGVGQDEPVETAQVEEPAQPTDTTDGTELTETELDIAALPLEESDEPATSSSAPVTDIFVEAVEIDGETVFVAGHAEPGRFVRVYANEILLGETRASEGGRFLIEARVDLPIGDYIIRADLLGSDGSVIARAAVPFEREPGESIAAVAPRAPAAQPEPAGQGDASSGVEMEAGADERAAETAAAPAEEQLETAAAAPEAGELSDEGQADAAGATTEDQPAAAMAPSEGEPAVESGDQAAAADEAQVTVPSPAASQQPELSAAETSDAPAEEQVAAPAGTPDTSGAPGEQMAAAEPGADATLSPALERVDGAVIIRRGDNLWRISRRVYGQGVRFSTIYLANQDQIRNPDLIWPGQVFTVPAETAQGEAADLEALGEQAVDPSQVPGEIIR